MSKSRLEKFLYALYSLDSSDLPTPLSRIEELYKCLVTGEEAPTFKPLSRVEKYLMAILGGYDVDLLPNPLSRVEVLLYKLATGDDNLDDIKSFLSEHEELLAEIIRNGGAGGNIDIEYVLYTLSTEFNTLYNTAEKPVKSAILKGRTLVNLVNDVTSNEVGNYSNSPCKINVIRNLQNETLTIIFNVISLEIPDGADGTLRIGGGWSGQIRYQPTLGVNKVLYNYNQTSNSWLGVFSNSGAYNLGQRITISDVMVLEGDYTNIDIPYFEGMKSVQMPVLTTTGKNLFDINHFSKLENWDGKTSSERPYYAYEMKLKPNTSYIFSRKENSTANNVYFCISKNQGVYDWTGGIIHPTDTSAIYQQRTITTDSTGILYFNLYQAHNELANLIPLLEDTQLEESSAVTTYEPFKSNILTTNEEVTLRGIGEVKDELNLLTGELTERIGEMIMDDTTSIELYEVTTDAGTVSFYYFMGDGKSNKPNGYTYHYCDSLPVFQQGEALADRSKEWTFYNEFGGSTIFFNIKQDKVGGATLKHIKDYLKYNPIKITYVLENEEVKTVDLSVVNQDGNDTKLSTFNDITHVTLSSEGLIPEAELEVATKNEEDLDYSIVYTIRTLSEEFNTLYNTAEKPVKSAILKGRTLVNLLPNKGKQGVSVSGNRIVKYPLPHTLKKNTKYLVYYNVEDISNPSGSNSLQICMYSKDVNVADFIDSIDETGLRKHIFTTSDKDFEQPSVWFFVFNGETTEAIFDEVMILEYQDGMENWDIPYFEGMQSVKMPVLTTTGSNMVNPTDIEVIGCNSYDVDSDGIVNVVGDTTGYWAGSYIRYTHHLKGNTTYYIYCNGDSTGTVKAEGWVDNINSGKISWNNFYKYTPETDVLYEVKIFLNTDASPFTCSKIRIGIFESTTKPSSFEPYKSNILTVNEEVELRGIGDVKDELDLITGELTERIGEIVLDGSDIAFTSNNNYMTEVSTAILTSVFSNNYNLSQSIMCKDLPVYMHTDDMWQKERNIVSGVSLVSNIWGFCIRLPHTLTGVTTADSEDTVKQKFKAYLQQNPITVQYNLATESIKTVDLSVVDQDGNNTELSTFNDITHVTLSSEGLIPEAELEVAEKVPEVAANMLTISREQEVINATANEQSENVDSTMIATTEIYEDLL